LSDYWGQDRQLSQAEKRKEVLRDTFMHRAAADAELTNQGRFKKQNETTVVGATPSAPYPQQPASSPWGGDNLIPAGGDLDYIDTDISAVEPILPERRDDATSANGASSPSVDASAPEATEAVSASPPSVASTHSRKSAFRRF
jgi:hypothetical protein